MFERRDRMELSPEAAIEVFHVRELNHNLFWFQ
jgi:hypothetical protein